MELDVPDSVRLHIEVEGPEAGPLVLFLHGALASGRAFRGQVPALRDRYRIALPDQRAHGRSTGHDPTFAQLVDDALRMTDALSPGAPVHLVGVSMGGMVAARVASARPERVATLTLISAPPAPDPKWMTYFGSTPPEALPEPTQRLARHWHGESRWRDLARGLFARFAVAPPEAFEGRPRVARALVMQAANDELLSPGDPELWRSRIDGPVTIVRPPGDHAFFADGREGTRAANHALRRFLDGQ